MKARHYITCADFINISLFDILFSIKTLVKCAMNFCCANALWTRTDALLLDISEVVHLVMSSPYKAS